MPIQYTYRSNSTSQSKEINTFGEMCFINTNARLYDPLLGRFLQPDNLVQQPEVLSNYNRYTYVLNNPLKYKDPSGELPVILIPIAIGVISGGYMGWQIGKAAGAEGWEMVGYITGGAVIGGVSGFLGGVAGSAVAGANFAGASALGAMVGGGVSGGFAGAGYAALAGNDVSEGAWKGAVSGAAGGFAGGAIGGGWGAFFGGATASGLGTALNGGTPEQIAMNSVLGGLTGWGAYELSTYLNYRFNYRGNLNYSGYRKVQALIGRANFWDGEASWYELEDGSVAQTKWRPFVKGINPREPVPGAIYESHSHPAGGKGFGFAGPTDIKYWQITGGDYNFKVYSSKYEYIYSRNQINNLTIDQTFYQTSKYLNFAEKNYLNIGFNHYLLNINFYGIFFWR